MLHTINMRLTSYFASSKRSVGVHRNKPSHGTPNAKFVDGDWALN